MHLLLFLALLFAAGSAAAVCAQPGSFPQQPDDPYLREHEERRAKNPEGVSFTVRVKDNRKQFHHGEVITLELAFASSKPDTFTLDAATYDRSGRLHSDGFVLDPQDGAVDPLVDYFNSGALMVGGLRSIPNLTEKPYLITADLNEWKRIDKPGRYRMYVTSNRVGRKGVGGGTFLSGGRVPVVSNVIEFDVVPPNEKWANQKLNEIVTVLSKTDGDRNSACRALRFLGTTAAVIEMRKRFRGDDRDCEWQYSSGLIGSAHRDFVLRDMENAISLREQPITISYITTLTLLEFTKRAGERPPYPGETNQEQMRQWETLMARRESVRTEVRLHYLRQLMLALPQKQEQARATSLQTLIDFRSDLNTRDFAQWTTLLASMSEVFNRLSPDDQVRLLTYQWKPIANAAMLPALREVLKYPYKPQQKAIAAYQQEQLHSIALRRIYELSPEEGRRLIIEEIRHPKPLVTREVLRWLPDEPLPEVNAVLLNNLEESQRTGNPYTPIISALIERYATDEIFSRVRAVYETKAAGKWDCLPQAALLAYFLRVAPAVGGEYFRKALDARGQHSSRCYTQVLSKVAELHVCPEVEATAIAALDDEDPAVVSQAAAVLGEHGSADAEKALWQRFEKWHTVMQSRSGEITEELTAPQKNIEKAFHEALTRGQAWLSDPAKLKRVHDLCLSDDCRSEADRMSKGWNLQIDVVFDVADDELSRISIAHYGNKSMAAFKQRLRQFPKGTEFKLKITTTRGEPSKSPEILQQIQSYLEELGMKLTREREQ